MRNSSGVRRIGDRFGMTTYTSSAPDDSSLARTVPRSSSRSRKMTSCAAAGGVPDAATTGLRPSNRALDKWYDLGERHAELGGLLHPALGEVRPTASLAACRRERAPQDITRVDAALNSIAARA